MFKQLTYFQYLEDDVRGLQERAKELNARLADSYSPPERVYCSLKNHIDAILLEQEQLSSLLSVILQQVTSDTFVPAQVDSLLLAQLAPHSILPQWFPHVLETQYGKAKPQLNSYARSLSNMHELQQKRKMMREERESLQTLYRRSIAISATQKNEHFTDIDIMQDVEHLRNRIKHVRKTYQYFCSQVANKLREFVEQLIDKTITFSRNQSPPSLIRSGKMTSEVFRKNDNMDKVRSYNYVTDLPEESFKTYEKVRNISPRNQLAATRMNSLQVELPKSNHEDYYGRALEMRAGQNLSPRAAHTHTHTHQQDYALFGSRVRSNCRNHEQQSTLHRHTCEKGRGWLRSAKSEQRFKLASSPDSSKYNYRRYIPTSEYY